MFVNITASVSGYHRFRHHRCAISPICRPKTFKTFCFMSKGAASCIYAVIQSPYPCPSSRRACVRSGPHGHFGPHSRFGPMPKAASAPTAASASTAASAPAAGPGDPTGRCRGTSHAGRWACSSCPCLCCACVSCAGPNGLSHEVGHKGFMKPASGTATSAASSCASIPIGGAVCRELA